EEQVLGRYLAAQTGHRAGQDLLGPAAAEGLVGRRLRRRQFQLRLHEVEGAAALLGAGPVELVREKVGERAEEIRPEPALVRGDGAEELALQQRPEKPLSEVLRRLDVLAAPADEEVDGLPVDADESVERVARPFAS